LEEKVLEEMEDVKRQLKRYEDIIARRQEINRKEQEVQEEQRLKRLSLQISPGGLSISSSRVAGPSQPTSARDSASEVMDATSVSAYADTTAPFTPARDGLRSMTSNHSEQSQNGSNVGSEMVRRWKAQNDKLRRELAEALQGSSSSLAGPSHSVAAPEIRVSTMSGRVLADPTQREDHESLASPTKSEQGDDEMDEFFRRSLNESERRRREIEDENRRLLSVISEAQQNLSGAKSPLSSRASTSEQGQL
jgi:hypothetical protein